MVASGADIGLALDGDADRLIVVDEKGRIVDGDQLMALIALNLARSGELQGRRGGRDGDVQPRARAQAGEAGSRPDAHPGRRPLCARGDARASGCNVGGEQSGHIILTDHATTGDGLVAGLQVLAALVESGKPASEVAPPVRSGAAAAQERPLQRRRSRSRARASRRVSPTAEAELDGHGRLVIRKSGTEPLIRVMAEGDDHGAAGRDGWSTKFARRSRRA